MKGKRIVLIPLRARRTYGVYIMLAVAIVCIIASFKLNPCKETADGARIHGEDATRVGKYESEWRGESSGIEDALDELDKILPSGAPKDDEELTESVGIKAMLSSLISGVLENRGTLSSHLLLMLGVATLLLCAEQTAVLSSDSLHTGASAATAAVLAIPVFYSLVPLLDAVKESLDAGGQLFGALLPIMTSLTALGGMGATAAAESACMNIALGFASGFLSEYVMPLAAMFFSLSLVTAADADGISASIASAVKGIFMFIIGGVSTLLLAALALQTVITTGSDGIAMRGIKYAVSGMIPIVGGTVSGALSTLAAGLRYAGGVVGVSSIAALIGIMGAPVITLLVYRIIMKIAVSISSLSGTGFGSRMLSSFLSATDALIATLVFSSLIYVFEIIIFMRCIVGGA